jgi:2-methylcitrate dehydratase PrpD
MACGIVHNFATMTKPLHAGMASRNGVLAAKLAESGFTANPELLEERKGFFDVYSKGLPFELYPLENLGRSFDLVDTGIKIKAYPCGGLTHSAIDAVLKMREQHRITAEEVESLKVGVTQHIFNTISGRYPQSGLQGKFSMPYVLARALVDGKVVLDTFTSEAIRDPLVRSVAEKINMELDADLGDTMEGGRPCKVTVKLKDGRNFSERIDHSRGSRQVPLTPEELRAKFTECACRTLRKDAADQAADMLDGLEKLDSLEPLCELLIARP